MAESGFKYRVIYKDESGKAQLAVFTSEKEANAWCVGHPGAFIVMYLVIKNGSIVDKDIFSREKAEEIAAESEGTVHVMNPGNLDSSATEILYQEC